MSPAAAEIRFACPACGASNELDPRQPHCAGCGLRLADAAGVFDLVPAGSKATERDFYDGEYQGEGGGGQLAIDGLESLWDLALAPQNRLIRATLPALAGRDVLLIGNGASDKELAFLRERPRRLVYSDLSSNAARRIQARYDLRGYGDCLRFAAVDAEALPFAAQSFDVLYGHAMVHHLPDVPRFLSGAVRCLRPGGMAVFMDDAFAPLWHYSKQTWLKPLMRYSHRRTGISPEDYRFSMSGGFREAELARPLHELGVEPFFHRLCFIDYVLARGAEKLLPGRFAAALTSAPVMRGLSALDRGLARLAWYRRNQIRLVWGFRVPGAA